MEQILIAGGVIFIVFFSALLIWLYRQGRPAEGGNSQAFRARALAKSIPKLREIAKQYPREQVGREAQIFMFNWASELEPRVNKMRGSSREKFLASLYYTRVFPILEEHKRLQQQTRRDTK